MAIVVTLPIKTVSEANSRDGWRKKAKRVQSQRGWARTVVRQDIVMFNRRAAEKMIAPFIVTMTRVAPSEGLDSDNLASSLKATRDGIADALGIDDGSDLVEWRYAQRRGAPRQYVVEIEIRAKDDRMMGES